MENGNARGGSPLMTLNDGRAMPQLGLGLMRFGDTDLTGVVIERAFAAGYRLFDTASVYDTETQTGLALRGLPCGREAVFVTTKLWNDAQGAERVVPALERSLDRLGLDYLDLYLIHWPMPMRDLYVESWRELIRLREEGRIRSIGVSNFEIAHLQRLMNETGVVPVVNQVEAHPYFQQQELHAFHRRHCIVTQAWSPFGAGGKGIVGTLLEDPVIVGIAARHGVAPSQVVLRWHVAQGMSVIPKATSEQHLAQNLAALSVDLDEDDLAALAGLDRADGRSGANPMTMDYTGRRSPA